MIGSLRGTLTELEPEGDAIGLLVDVGGVGYRVLIALNAVAAVGPVGSQIHLSIYTYVHEGAIALYGFVDRAERRCFEMLLAAHGVGPALALAILGVHSPTSLQRAVATANVDALVVVPGVGKKTAQRLVIDLANRVESLGTIAPRAVVGSAPGERETVREALTSLGYATDEIREALDQMSEDGSAEELLREALRRARAAPVSPRREVVTTVVPEPSEERPVTPFASAPDEAIEAGIRPRHLADFVGQTALKEHLGIVLEAARRRQQPVDHLLFAGPPGLGKTTLAGIVATEMGAGFRITSGPAIGRGGDLAAILTGLQPGDVLFIDEIHRLNRAVEEILYPAMEDYEIDIVIGKGPTARSVRLELPPFTLVGATTRTGLVTGPLRDRFGFVARLEHYSVVELEQIVQRSGGLLGVTCSKDGAREIAGAHRGTPRLAIRLLRRVRDFVEVRGSGVINVEAAREGCTLFGVDELGLDRLDRRLLETLCLHFGGRPVGLTTLAVSVGEEPDTIEDVYEPFLVQAGLVMRTPRGRVPAPGAWVHLGLEPPRLHPVDRGPTLFEASET